MRKEDGLNPELIISLLGPTRRPSGTLQRLLQTDNSQCQATWSFLPLVSTEPKTLPWVVFLPWEMCTPICEKRRLGKISPPLLYILGPRFDPLMRLVFFYFFLDFFWHFTATEDTWCDFLLDGSALFCLIMTFFSRKPGHARLSGEKEKARELADAPCATSEHAHVNFYHNCPGSTNCVTVSVSVG